MKGLRLALAFTLLSSCSSALTPVPPVLTVPLGDTPSAAQLRDLLESIETRDDLEALRARGRIYARLRAIVDPLSAELTTLGDAADIDLLSRIAPEEYKAEAAGRLAGNFRLRAETPALCKSAFPGPLGVPLLKVTLLTAAAFFGEWASREEFADLLDKLSAASETLAEAAAMGPEGRAHWHDLALQASRRAAELRSATQRIEPSAEARKFCERGLDLHLEGGTRAADFGTREKVSRRELEGVVRWYIQALSHFAVVRESSIRLTPTRENGLAVQEIVVRSLSDLLCRDP